MAASETVESSRRGKAPIEDPQARLSLGGGLSEAVVLVVGTAVAAVRLGLSVGDSVPWAEDIQVFVRGAAAAPNGLSPLWDTYAGYLHVVPRLVAAACLLLPASWAATFLVLVCAFVQGVVAAFAWHVLRSFSVAPWARLVAVIPVVIVPVGVETVLSLANLQWFLLYAALLASLWQPRRWPGRAVQAVILVAAALSSPFGALPVAALAVAAVVTRARSAVPVVAAGAAAAAVQLFAMRSSSSSRALHLGFDPGNLAATYLRRVVADGMLGVARNGPTTTAPGIRLGLLCLAVVLVILAIAVVVGGRETALRLLALFTLSVAAFSAPAVLEAVAGVDPGYQGRYFLAPALLWVSMVSLALSVAVRLTGPFRLPVRVACAVVAVAIVAGAAWSYPVRIAGREGVPPWRAQLEAADATCAASPGAEIETIQIAPRGWRVDFTCTDIIRW